MNLGQNYAIQSRIEENIDFRVCLLICLIFIDDTHNKIAYITYNKKEDCTLAVEKLNKTIFNGHRITVRISGKKKLEGEESKDIETTKVQEIYEDKEKEVLDTTKTEKINRKARLIVRNLSFKVRTF